MTSPELAELKRAVEKLLLYHETKLAYDCDCGIDTRKALADLTAAETRSEEPKVERIIVCAPGMDLTAAEKAVPWLVKYQEQGWTLYGERPIAAPVPAEPTNEELAAWLEKLAAKRLRRLGTEGA